jgi:membrane protein
MKYLKHVVKSLWHAAVDMVNHDGIEHAGYLAFLSLLSIFPFLVFVTAITGFLGDLSLGRKFIAVILTSLPTDIVALVRPRIEEITASPPQSLMTLAIVGAVWTASSSVEGLRTSLNKANRITTPPAYVWRRLLSILQFLFFTIVLLLGFLLFVLLPILADSLSNYVPSLSITESIIMDANIRYFIWKAMLFFWITFLYYILPNTRISLKHIMPGALLVVALWSLTSTMLTGYFTQFNQVNVIYGSLRGFIISMIFFYVGHMVIIYGAEFNYRLRHYVRR